MCYFCDLKAQNLAVRYSGFLSKEGLGNGIFGDSRLSLQDELRDQDTRTGVKKISLNNRRNCLDQCDKCRMEEKGKSKRKEVTEFVDCSCSCRSEEV